MNGLFPKKKLGWILKLIVSVFNNTFLFEGVLGKSFEEEQNRRLITWIFLFESKVLIKDS